MYFLKSVINDKKDGKAKHILLLKDILIFFSILTSFFIWENSYEFYWKLKNFSKLYKHKVLTPVTVPEMWKNFRIF
jgi:hypothetical protein